jgi:F-type H+-transporting ATPase subunit b
MADYQPFLNGLAAVPATVEHHEGVVEDHGGAHVDPVAFGFIGPAAWVSLAMLVLLLILLWKGVPKLIAGGLDARIAAIRSQLEDARALREEAESLRNEYASKIANAQKDAEAMLEGARRESAAIVERAEADTAAMILRRERMAEDKIAAAERAAIDELRMRAARASADASGRIIAQKHNAIADRTLVDNAIANI